MTFANIPKKGFWQISGFCHILQNYHYFKKFSSIITVIAPIACKVFQMGNQGVRIMSRNHN